MASFRSSLTGLRQERIHASPRWHDGGFHNTTSKLPGGVSLGTAATFFFGGQQRVPPAPLPSLSPLVSWGRPPETGLRASWLGHSTVLLEIDGVRVLTDPVWGDRASPVRFAGPRRFQPVPVAIADLPPIDVVVISHDHYDHLCRDSVVELARTGVRFVTGLGVGAHLESYGIPAAQVVELDWWEHLEVRGLRVTAAPAQHFSGRVASGRNKTLWSSLALRGPRHAVFFSGDTGLTAEYEEIRRRLGPFDLVLLEVGAWHPEWGGIHLGPENALEALALLGGGALLPVHWGTFNLAIHAWDEPIETLVKLAPARGARLITPRLGDAVEPERFERVEPWWRTVGARPEPVPAPAEDTPAAPLPDPID